MLDELVDNDDAKRLAVGSAARNAIEARLALWDAIIDDMSCMRTPSETAL
jgi:hypothetical protein